MLTPHEQYKLLSLNPDYVECQLEVLKESEKAICFNTYAGYLDKQIKAWVPKSQCEFVEHVDFGRRVFIRMWAYRQTIGK